MDSIKSNDIEIYTENGETILEIIEPNHTPDISVNSRCCVRNCTTIQSEVISYFK